jgi:hypothetical protein
MKTYKEYITELKKPRYELPPEPGTTKVGDDEELLWHQTQDKNVSSIRKKGLEKRTPREGPHGLYASPPKNGKGFYGTPKDKATIEFKVKKSEYRAPFVQRNVKPEEIISAHKPWHQKVRDLDSQPKLRADIEKDEGGNYSKLLKNPLYKGDETVKAVRFMMKRAKAQQGK